MNLLKQPLLAGDSGSGRIRKVKDEDRREEGVMFLMLRQWGRRKDDRIKKHKHHPAERRDSCWAPSLCISLYPPPSLCVCFCSSLYHLSIKFNFKPAARARGFVRKTTTEYCNGGMLCNPDSLRKQAASEHGIREIESMLSCSSSELCIDWT